MRKTVPAIALVLVIVGCTAPAAPAGPVTSPTVVATAAAPSATPAESGSLQRKVTIDGVDRFYTLYVPRALDRSKASPLVIFLHGSGITASATERDAGLDAQADR